LDECLAFRDENYDVSLIVILNLKPLNSMSLNEKAAELGFSFVIQPLFGTEGFHLSKRDGILFH
jgi:hypothetical protein